MNCKELELIKSEKRIYMKQWRKNNKERIKNSNSKYWSKKAKERNMKGEVENDNK